MSRRRLALAVIVGTVGLTACGTPHFETRATTPTTAAPTTTVRWVAPTTAPDGSINADRYRAIRPGLTTCAELDRIVTAGGEMLSESTLADTWTAYVQYTAATGGTASVIVQRQAQQPCVVVSKSQYGLS